MSGTSQTIQVYRYGEAARLRGLCIGVTRYPPRGIRRDTWSELGICDVWLPNLAPSRDLVAAYRRGKISHAVFLARYRSEMRTPGARHLIELLAGIARLQPINLGCICADPARCHRSVLRQLIVNAQTGLRVRSRDAPRIADNAHPCASPPCDMPEIVD